MANTYQHAKFHAFSGFEQVLQYPSPLLPKWVLRDFYMPQEKHHLKKSPRVQILHPAFLCREHIKES